MIRTLDGAGAGQLLLRVSRALAFWMALTSSFLLIDERPGTSRRLATSYRWALLALASTPPSVFQPRPVCSADSSLGPFLPLGSQWSPTFSNPRLSEEKAVRAARSPLPCSSAAES